MQEVISRAHELLTREREAGHVVSVDAMDGAEVLLIHVNDLTAERTRHVQEKLAPVGWIVEVRSAQAM